MRISVTIFIILISTYVVNASVLDPVIENVVHLKASKPPPGVNGIWKKKTIWKPRWVKEWKSAKVMKPVWRKVWSPVQIREWLPIPKPPPGWDLLSTPLAPVHAKPQNAAPAKDSQGHDSFAAHSSVNVPLWDPVPYPESQQPPPPPPPSVSRPLYDNSPSQTFNQRQISEILGPKYQTSETYQNPEYSETVDRPTRLPPDANNWRPPPDFQLNAFSGLPVFLVPPKFQPLPENNFRQPFLGKPDIPVALPFEGQSVPKWTPLPPENKIQGHLVTKAPDHPYKFQFPEPRNNATIPNREPFQSSHVLQDKPNFQIGNATTGRRPDGDFIQEAQLVGEYHYSEFDLPGVKQEPKKPQPKHQDKEAKPKPQHAAKLAENEPKPNPTQKLEDKPRQTRTDVKQPELNNVQSGPNVQKKHIPDSAWNLNLNFQQQEAIIKEIFPIFKNHNLNQIEPKLKSAPPPNQGNRPPNHSTKLHPVAPGTDSNSSSDGSDAQQKKDIYPVYERVKSTDAVPNFFPKNHRFSPSQENQFPSNATKLNPAASDKPERPSSDKSSILQLVFPSSPADENPSAEASRTTTTTEPYEIIFSSSSLSTTEAVTKTPVIIVTPVNPGRS